MVKCSSCAFRWVVCKSSENSKPRTPGSLTRWYSAGTRVLGICDVSYVHSINKLLTNYCETRDPVYMVPDLHGHDIKLNSSTTSVALTLTIALQNLSNKQSDKKVVRVYDRKLPDLDVGTKRIRYPVNGV